MTEKELMRQMIAEGKQVHDFMIVFGKSKTSIARYLKRYKIKAPPGFFHIPGSTLGRPKGIPMSEEQKQFLSKQFKGEGNPFFGQHHSTKTRRKMSRNHSDVTGDKNPFKKSLQDPEKLRQHKERCQQIWNNRDEIWRNKFKQTLSKALGESQSCKNKKFHKSHLCGFLQTHKAGRIFYRSSWEKLFALYLDENDHVQSFMLEPFCIPYIDEVGIKRYSRIDFHITFQNGHIAIIEIKPQKLQKLPRNAAKIIGYKQFCDVSDIQFSLVDEHNINNKVALDALMDNMAEL